VAKRPEFAGWLVAATGRVRETVAWPGTQRSLQTSHEARAWRVTDWPAGGRGWLDFDGEEDVGGVAVGLDAAGFEIMVAEAIGSGRR